jgi:S-formylglutathione hydrolase FrmB
MKPTTIPTILLCMTAVCCAGQVRRGTLHSTALSRNIGYIAVLPDNYSQQVAGGKRFPVVYLLHCAGCDTGSWVNEPGYCTPLTNHVDSAGCIFVAPDDGQVLSWWLDSPVRQNSSYSTFLVGEFKPFVDATFATVPDRAHTGVAGHSMGGFGALHNIIAHPDVFGAAYSLMGGADIAPCQNNWGLSSILGADPAQYRQNCRAVNPVDNACKLVGQNVSLAFVSGTADFFHSGNALLHRVLDSCGVAHQYNAGVDTTAGHSPIPQEYSRAMVSFFDSVFASAVPVSRPSVTTRDVVRGAGSSGFVACTITGRRLGSQRSRWPAGVVLSFGHDRRRVVRVR